MDKLFWSIGGVQRLIVSKGIMAESPSTNEIKELCHRMRIDCLAMAEAAGSSGMHFGGTLSMIEIIAALYIKKMKVSKDYFFDDNRDRVIISKGHGVPALYAVLHQLDIISDDDIKSFKSDVTKLYGHPSMNQSMGIEFSSGSLGQGLSLGVGTALGLLHKGKVNAKTFVILGDGECDEGEVWEAAMSASKYRLKNLMAIIDQNHLQYDGNTEDVMPLTSLKNKWGSFGWNTIEVDGHNVDACYEAFSEDYTKPTAIIADTVKGKGISFIENDFSWHHKQMTKKQMLLARKELGLYD